MGYNPDSVLSQKAWKEIQPDLKECLEADMSIQEFWAYMGWENREPWYRIKPHNFKWESERIKAQKNGGFKKLEVVQEDHKLTQIKKEEAAKRQKERQKKRWAIITRFGVKNLRELDCTSVAEFERKLKSGVIHKKYPGKDKENPTVVETKVVSAPINKKQSVAAKPVKKGTVMVVMCDTNNLSDVLRNLKEED